MLALLNHSCNLFLCLPSLLSYFLLLSNVFLCLRCCLLKCLLACILPCALSFCLLAFSIHCLQTFSQFSFLFSCSPSHPRNGSCPASFPFYLIEPLPPACLFAVSLVASFSQPCLFALLITFLLAFSVYANRFLVY